MQTGRKPRTKRYALRIIKMFAALPKKEVARVLGRQVLVESATVPARKMSALLQETDELVAIFTTISKETKARSGLHPS